MMLRKPLLWLIVGALVLGTGAAAIARSIILARGEAQLLAIDADAALSDPDLMRLALARAPGLYRSSCAACHGADLKGDRRIGAPDLTDKDWLFGEGRVSEIEQTITFGVRSGDPKGRNLASMPAFARPEPYDRYHIPPLGPEDIRAAVEYLRAIEGEPADPAMAARGDRVFHGGGGCYDCHGQDALGDGAIGAPNLRDTVWLYGDGSRRGLIGSIAYGRAGACPAQVHRLKAADIRSIALYIHTRGPQGGRP